MKNYCNIFIGLLLTSFFAFGQGTNWRPTIDLQANMDIDDRIDLYVNQHGLHVIIQNANNLVYCLFDPVTGELLQDQIRDDNVTEDPRISRIVGFGNSVYIIYKEGNRIKTQRSTDGGATWSTSAVDEISMANSTSNGMDAWINNDGIHLAYSQANSYYGYETWYRKYNFLIEEWEDQKEVTDVSTLGGGLPSISVSSNRIHVTFTDGDYSFPPNGYEYAQSFTRDRLGSIWQDSQSLDDGSYNNYVIATNNELHGFYFHNGCAGVPPPCTGYYNLYYRNRPFYETTWSTQTLILELAEPQIAPLDMAITADDLLHIVPGNERYAYYDGATWYGLYPNEWKFTDAQISWWPNIAASGNDVFIIWVEPRVLKTGNGLFMRQRDFAPLTPQNTSISASPANHPLIEWDVNAEADIDFYRIYKRNAAFQYVLYGTSTTNSFEDPNEQVAGEPGANQYLVHYKVSAVDLQDNESPLTDPIKIIVQGSPQSKLSNTEVQANTNKQPQLINNYPNPFNPETKIRFFIPEPAMVSLTIYDVQGRMVKQLVNAIVDQGIYDFTWDGRDQTGQAVASGTYVYTLQTATFTQSRKMILMR